MVSVYNQADHCVIVPLSMTDRVFLILVLAFLPGYRSD